MDSTDALLDEELTVLNVFKEKDTASIDDINAAFNQQGDGIGFESLIASMATLALVSRGLVELSISKDDASVSLTKKGKRTIKALAMLEEAEP